jgi:hypothetical protein
MAHCQVADEGNGLSDMGGSCEYTEEAIVDN